MLWYEHIFYAIKQGDWACGFSTRKAWKNKPYFSAGTTFYDGHHAWLHLATFYIAVSWY